MGCSSCGKRATAAAVYPRTVTLPDGSQVEVSSAADERAQRLRAQERMRERAAARGYSVTRR
jgi:hypothetical protein